MADYDDSAAFIYGEIRADLEKRGQIIGPLDMMIAAHALSLDMPLVTNNNLCFRRGISFLGLNISALRP